MISAPEEESRFPVGSSARIIDGSAASTRAIDVYKRQGLNIPERVDGMGNLTDGELVARVRQGNQEAFSELISRYYGLLQWKISGYRKLGIDADDLLQEAALGLLDSVMSFQEGKGASFETYATVCVNNRLVTLYRAAARQKNIPFHSLAGFPEEKMCIRDRGWHDPRIVPYGPIELDPAAMCLHYGQEVFEGMKAYKTADGRALLFRPEKNMARLNRSNERLCIPLVEDVYKRQPFGRQSCRTKSGKTEQRSCRAGGNPWRRAGPAGLLTLCGIHTLE